MRKDERRAQELLKKMTLREKTGQISHELFGWDCYRLEGQEIILTEIFKQSVKYFGGMGLLYGLMRADPWSGRGYSNGLTPSLRVKATALLQKYVQENTRLQIPILFEEESPHGHQALGSTLFPTNIGVGCTFNPKLYKRAMTCMAREIKLSGTHAALVSMLDICRDPRWGRTEECYGEDPFLSARFAEAAVKGIHSENIAVCAKHYCAQGACEGGQNLAAANIGERELREIHLPPAEAAVKADADIIMASYNEVDGIPVHANKKLLIKILREEFGFKGIIHADGTAIDRLASQTNNDLTEAGALALKSGVDTGLWDKAFTYLENAVEQGFVNEAEIDEAVLRVLILKYKLGLFDKNHAPKEEDLSDYLLSGQSKTAAYQLAAESLVLLKNSGNLLPLSKDLKICVIGENADSVYHLLGDYTSERQSGEVQTLLQGIRKHNNASYAQGWSFDGSTEGFLEAVQKAKECEVIIIVLGGSSVRDFTTEYDKSGAAKKSKSFMDCGEGTDVAELTLPGSQNEMLLRLKALGKPIVSILIQGRPYSITEAAKESDAILAGWYPGQEGAAAIADTLFGKNNPSGKLSISIPFSSSQLPVCYNRKDLGKTYSYQNSRGIALYPFGYGLSYSKFELLDLTSDKQGLSTQQLQNGEKFIITAKVKNISDLKGKETVLLYIKFLNGSVTSRIKELKGFSKLEIAEGESESFTFLIGYEELKRWTAEEKMSLERGKLTVSAEAGQEKLALGLEIKQIR